MPLVRVPMSTNDDSTNGGFGQKRAPSESVQVNLNEALQHNIILQQLEGEIEEYRRQNGGQESIKSY